MEPNKEGGRSGKQGECNPHFTCCRLQINGGGRKGLKEGVAGGAGKSEGVAVQKRRDDKKSQPKKDRNLGKETLTTKKSGKRAHYAGGGENKIKAVGCRRFLTTAVLSRTRFVKEESGKNKVEKQKGRGEPKEL